MANELIPTEAAGPLAREDSWQGAAERGLAARNERNAIIAKVLKDGEDFGIIPGTDKPALFKSGAEKVTDALNLYAEYEELRREEDWDRPLFFYRYRALLKQRGSDIVIATGVGSCNSMEARYRWRKANRVCPRCGREAIIKGRDEYGGGWLCFKKKDGCGAKFVDGDATIESQVAGNVENDDVYSLVNTIDKMAQKRALVAATLNLGFSSHFTQDVEDQPAASEERRATAGSEPPDESDAMIDDAQRRKLWAVGRKLLGGDAETKKALAKILPAFGYKTDKAIRVSDFDAICEAFADHVAVPRSETNSDIPF